MLQLQVFICWFWPNTNFSCNPPKFFAVFLYNYNMQYIAWFSLYFFLFLFRPSFMVNYRHLFVLFRIFVLLFLFLLTLFWFFVPYIFVQFVTFLFILPAFSYTLFVFLSDKLLLSKNFSTFFTQSYLASVVKASSFFVYFFTSSEAWFLCFFCYFFILHHFSIWFSPQKIAKSCPFHVTFDKKYSSVYFSVSTPFW